MDASFRKMAFGYQQLAVGFLLLAKSQRPIANSRNKKRPAHSRGRHWVAMVVGDLASAGD
jgi:hypothetical protein